MEYEHEFIKFNNFIILLNINKHAKTTLVESYINKLKIPRKDISNLLKKKV